MSGYKTMKVRITFQDELLGTKPSNPDVYGDYIASKAPDAKTMAEEIEAFGVEEVAEKGTTIFLRNADGVPYLEDYTVKGFFKDSAAALRKVPGTVSSKVKAFKKEIDGLVFIKPREIILHMSGEMSYCQRPLRASTPMGERVSLAKSECAPAGTWIEFEIECLTDTMYDLVVELLDYGALRGMGQWRNSGKGRFVWEWLE